MTLVSSKIIRGVPSFEGHGLGGTSVTDLFKGLLKGFDIGIGETHLSAGS
jgi:hypothetical protein